MAAYLPIMVGQGVLQWLRHLPCCCIDRWADFCDRFIANYQSLSDKPAQPWDLKSFRCNDDESLRLFLKHFQSMRNCIPNITEMTMIEHFFYGPTMGHLSKPSFKKLQRPPSNSSGRPTSTSPPTNGPTTSSFNQGLKP